VVMVGLLVVLVGVGVGVYLLVDSLRDDEKQPAPAPSVIVDEQPAPATQDLGFPAFATKNTTRVAGVDPVADAAGVALAVFPATGGVEGPAAVTLVQEDDWASGIAAASLAAGPVGAPILLTGKDDIPDFTAEALSALAPAGSAGTDGTQIFPIGSATAPHDLKARRVTGANPAAIAAAVDRLRQNLTGARPQHIVLASSNRPAFAMPAAAWAARSGDPVLFVSKNAVPKPTLAALRRDKRIPVYVLGPPSVISDKALKEVRKVAPGARRVGATDAVQNAIDFARYASGSFGWDINDPGHGFVIASGGRPLDAAAGAPLSASGDWAPLLITNDPAEAPAGLRSYLLDVKPGYVDDPTRAVYNHVWLIGDQDAISVGFQAQVDDLAEVVQVRSGSGGRPGPAPGTPEPEQGKP
jgi:hypothetical protein